MEMEEIKNQIEQEFIKANKELDLQVQYAKSCLKLNEVLFNERYKIEEPKLKAIAQKLKTITKTVGGYPVSDLGITWTRNAQELKDLKFLIKGIIQFEYNKREQRWSLDGICTHGTGKRDLDL